MNFIKTLWKALKASKSCNGCGGDCEQGRLSCDCSEVKTTEKTETLEWPPEKNSVYQNGGLEGNNH